MHPSGRPVMKVEWAASFARVVRPQAIEQLAGAAGRVNQQVCFLAAAQLAARYLAAMNTDVSKTTR